jgi:hypothetical protein
MQSVVYIIISLFIGHGYPTTAHKIIPVYLRNILPVSQMVAYKYTGWL